LVNTSYETETKLGDTLVLLMLRKPLSHWQLLVASRDPISTTTFVGDVRSVNDLLVSEGQTRTLPPPATLLSPANGHFPQASGGQRFGAFRWRTSPSDDIVAEIAEFAYQDDARLFVRRPADPEFPN
jgi:hypothetical protein